jgi:hypothetical protein
VCKDEQSRLNFSKCQDLTTEACSVHKSSVSQICRDDGNTALAVPLGGVCFITLHYICMHVCVQSCTMYIIYTPPLFC